MFVGMRMAATFIKFAQEAKSTESMLAAYSMALMFFLGAYAAFRIAIDDIDG